jgi:hypothetical protein
MKHSVILLSTAALLLSGLSFAQTGKDGKGKMKDSVKTAPKPCPGKTCGKKKTTPPAH